MLKFYNSEKNDTLEMTAFLISCIHPSIAEQFDVPIIDFEEYQKK